MHRNIRKLWKRLLTLHYSNKAKHDVGGFEETLSANKKTILTKNTYLGKNTSFNGMTVLGKGRVTIGDNFHSGPNCIIRTQTHNHMGDALPYDRSYIVENVSIGDNVWLGEGVLILPGVSIGEGAIIQARSVVVSDIPALAIAGGHPCRAFSARNADRYHNLKSAQKFV